MTRKSRAQYAHNAHKKAVSKLIIIELDVSILSPARTRDRSFIGSSRQRNTSIHVKNQLSTDCKRLQMTGSRAQYAHNLYLQLWLQ